MYINTHTHNLSHAFLFFTNDNTEQNQVQGIELHYIVKLRSLQSVHNNS